MVADALLSQEIIFYFSGADLLYRTKKISWDSTRRTAHDMLYSIGEVCSLIHENKFSVRRVQMWT